MIVSGIVGIIAGIYLASSGQFDRSTLEYTEEGLKLIDQVSTYSGMFFNIIIILTSIIAWSKISKRPLYKMGLTPFKKDYKDFFVGLLYGIVSMSIVFGLLLVSGNASVESWQANFSSGMIIELIIFILVGFSEEIFGRGYIMSVLRQTKSLPMVMILSSIIFALLHGLNPGIGILPIINLSLVGALFAYMYIKSGNIWMPIGFHITWNYVQGNIFGFKVSGTDTDSLISTTLGTNDILTGGDFGPEGGLVVTLITVLGFLFVKYYYRNSTYDFMASDIEESKHA